MNLTKGILRLLTVGAIAWGVAALYVLWPDFPTEVQISDQLGREAMKIYNSRAKNGKLLFGDWLPDSVGTVEGQAASEIERVRLAFMEHATQRERMSAELELMRARPRRPSSARGITDEDLLGIKLQLMDETWDRRLAIEAELQDAIARAREAHAQLGNARLNWGLRWMLYWLAPVGLAFGLLYIARWVARGFVG